jgi:hypothetical protein
VKNFQIPLNPPFSKGEKALWFIEFPQIGSPPFDKGRTGGISGKTFSKHYSLTRILFLGNNGE